MCIQYKSTVILQSDDIPKSATRIVERSNTINIGTANIRRWHDTRTRVLCENVSTHRLRSSAQNSFTNRQPFGQQFGSLQVDVAATKTISTDHSDSLGK